MGQFKAPSKKETPFKIKEINAPIQTISVSYNLSPHNLQYEEAIKNTLLIQLGKALAPFVKWELFEDKIYAQVKVIDI